MLAWPAAGPRSCNGSGLLSFLVARPVAGMVDGSPSPVVVQVEVEVSVAFAAWMSEDSFGCFCRGCGGGGCCCCCSCFGTPNCRFFVGCFVTTISCLSCFCFLTCSITPPWAGAHWLHQRGRGKISLPPGPRIVLSLVWWWLAGRSLQPSQGSHAFVVQLIAPPCSFAHFEHHRRRLRSVMSPQSACTANRQAAAASKQNKVCMTILKTSSMSCGEAECVQGVLSPQPSQRICGRCRLTAPSCVLEQPEHHLRRKDDL